MRSVSIVLFVLVMLSISISVPHVSASTLIGYSINDEDNTFGYSPDGGFFIVGGTNATGSGDYDVFIAKTDNEMNVQWLKVIRGPDDEEDLGLAVSGSEVFIVGDTYSSPDDNIFVAKLSSDGSLLWIKEISISIDDAEFEDLATDSSGNLYILLTYFASTDDILLLKISGDGSIVWAKQIDFGATEDDASRLLVKSDGNIVITSVVSKETVIELTPNGDVVWAKAIDPGIDTTYYAEPLIELPDGSLLVKGTSDIAKIQFVAKLMSDGSLDWAKTINITSGDIRIYSMGITPNGSVLMAGYTTYNGGDRDSILLVTDLSIVPISVTAQGGDGGQTGYIVYSGSNCTYLAVLNATSTHSNRVLYFGYNYMIPKSDIIINDYNSMKLTDVTSRANIAGISVSVSDSTLSLLDYTDRSSDILGSITPVYGEGTYCSNVNDEHQSSGGDTSLGGDTIYNVLEYSLWTLLLLLSLSLLVIRRHI